jgi:alkaline phosphatase
MFASSHMDADIDRWKYHDTEPSIAKMTGKALEILARNDNGFCIMIEGSQVDWAGHQNDPVHMITDFLAWDAAVQEALDFAATNGDTMVIAFPDHDTGSMSIGHNQGPGAANHYTTTTIENLIDPIKDATISLNSVLDEMEALDCLSHAGVRDIMVTYWGSWWADPNNMSDAVAQEVANQVNLLGAYGAGYPVAEYLSKECTYFGWSTHGHLGEDVPVWTIIFGDAEGPSAVVDNTDLAKICAAALGLELTGSAPWDVYEIDVLDTTDINANPIATLPNGDQYKMNTNIKIVNGQEVETMYISVYNTNPAGEPVGKVYIPKM